MTTKVKIENIDDPAKGDLSEVIIVTLDTKNQVVDTHALMPGETKEIDVSGNLAFNISKRWRDAMPQKATVAE